MNLKKLYRLVAIALLLIGLAACEKKEEMAPFEDIKVKNIKVPGASYQNGSMVRGYHVTFIKYNQDKIEYITNRSEFAGKSTLNDSTRFFYADGTLNYATRVIISQSLNSYTFVQQKNYEFTRDAEGKIIQTTIKGTGVNPDVVSRYTYQNGRLISLQKGSQIDSIRYNDLGKIETVKTYNTSFSVFRPGSEVAEPKREVKINRYASSYSPYYIINNKLGFPFMASREVNIVPSLYEEIAERCVQAIYLTEFSNQLTVNGPVPDKEGTVELLYDTDKKGRVVGQYTEGRYDLRTIYEYY
ncbi:hypothetical protein [Botryobacter ruber]|uniref:hypothetical protein n=1 Tax=Botryobacter ruber TaxID=2171629 RepID=UPI000F654387|nr:hypothetical protein [Botryobacter ruber]